MSLVKSKRKPLEVASTLAQYLAIVEKLWLAWIELGGSIADIWFRGQTDSSWALLPSGYKDPYSVVSEHRYRHDFLLRSRPFLGEATSLPASDWEWYFLMQHYGVPTRLLDWTESAIAALYFAAQPSSPKKDGCVWVLNPRAVNCWIAKIGNFVPIYSHKSASRYLPNLWDEKVRYVPNAPIAIDPLHNSPRLTAQRGKFTVHGRSTKALDSYRKLGCYLVRIDVRSDAKGRIRRQLWSAGITESVLFPGLAGLSRELRDMYAIPWDI